MNNSPPNNNKWGSIDSHDDIESNVPEKYLCSITKEIMINPVVASDGYIYDESSLSTWLEKNGRSPITQEPMTDKDWFADSRLKDEINEWLLNHKEHEFVQKFRQMEDSQSHGGTLLSSSSSSNDDSSKSQPNDHNFFFRTLFIGSFILLPVFLFVLPRYFSGEDSKDYIPSNSPTMNPLSTCSSDLNTVSINFATGSHPSELFWKVTSNTTEKVHV